MPNQAPLMMEDENHQKLYYHFTPAAIGSNFIPLIVILSDEKDEVRHFEYKMWNVLTLELHFTKEDVSLQNLIQTLIEEIADAHECEEHIYMYGSGESAYAALYYGALCSVNAVYANTPSFTHKRVSEVLTLQGTFPIVYICDKGDNRDLSQEIDNFEAQCKVQDIQVKRQDYPSEEDENQNIKKVLNFFERVASEA